MDILHPNGAPAFPSENKDLPWSPVTALIPLVSLVLTCAHILHHYLLSVSLHRKLAVLLGVGGTESSQAPPTSSRHHSPIPGAFLPKWAHLAFASPTQYFPGGKQVGEGRQGLAWRQGQLSFPRSADFFHLTHPQGTERPHKKSSSPQGDKTINATPSCTYQSSNMWEIRTDRTLSTFTRSRPLGVGRRDGWNEEPVERPSKVESWGWGASPTPPQSKGQAPALSSHFLTV